MMKLSLLLLFQLFCIERVTSICHEYYAGLVPAMNGRIRDYAHIDKTQVHSLQDCFELCFLNTSCVTFFYNSVTGHCQTHSVLLKPLATDQIDVNWRYYQIYTEKCSMKDGLILYRKENLCYFLSNLKKTWTDAKKECNKRGWRFLKIEKKEIQVHLHMTVPLRNKQYYIGLRSQDANNGWELINGNKNKCKPLSTNKWVWSDGKMLNGFVSWAPDQSIRTGATCVFLAAHQQRMWNNSKCTTSINFICEKIL